MMTESLIPGRESETLPELLTRQVRALSGRALAASIATGALAVASSLMWRPFGWRVWALGGFCAVAMGMWAIADGELREDTSMRRNTRVLLRIICSSAALTGTLAALALAFTIVSVFIGTWRS